MNVEYVIPSHGEPFYDANQRIDEIWQHHEERLEKTLSVIKDGATAFQVCQALFEGNLTVHEYQFAIGEAIAHLEYLYDKNECIREEIGEKWIYKRL